MTLNRKIQNSKQRLANYLLVLPYNLQLVPASSCRTHLFLSATNYCSSRHYRSNNRKNKFYPGNSARNGAAVAIPVQSGFNSFPPFTSEVLNLKIYYEHYQGSKNQESKNLRGINVTQMLLNLVLNASILTVLFLFKSGFRRKSKNSNTT